MFYNKLQNYFSSGVPPYQTMKIRHRTEIDGLRSVAIIPVLFYHANIPGFSGGYIGVSVFFVISGYLITSLITKDLDVGSFSILSFWERRARRILPALTLVIIFVLIAGWLSLFASDFKYLGQSALAQSIFASNFYFLREAGYFTAEAASKPLLHTWSLAVEEQFYLLYPLLLLLISKYSRVFRIHIVIVLMAFSFLINMFWTVHYPERAFYLLPARAWELLIGATITCLPAGFAAPWKNELLSYVGLVAIGYAVTFYDQNTAYPGYAAILPCMGAAAIIFSNGSNRTIVGKFLSFYPFMFIGLISYSLYLWHWPLLAFANYSALVEVPTSYRLVLVAGSIVIAWLSWKHIETPFRKRQILPRRRQAFSASATALVAMGALGLLADLADGFPSRFPPEVLQYADGATEFFPRRNECTGVSIRQVNNDDLCKLGKIGGQDRPVLVSWGDSHATALAPILDKMGNESGVTIWHGALGGCMPVMGVFYNNGQDQCHSFNNAMFELVKRNGVKHVLLTARWLKYLLGSEKAGAPNILLSDEQLNSKTPDDSKTVFRRNMIMTVKLLNDEGVTVWIVNQVPTQLFNVPNQLAKTAWVGGNTSAVGRPLSEHLQRMNFINSVFDEVKSEGVHLLDPARILCLEKRFCRTGQNGRSLYQDNDHLSVYGAMQMRPMFVNLFNQISQ